MAVKKVKKERATTSKDIEDHILRETAVRAIDSSNEVNNYDVKQGEVHSDTKLESDTGHGGTVVVRTFLFKANPQSFKERTPSKQELFNAHAKQIEIQLWKDGMKVMPDVSPQLTLSKNRKFYRIVVGAEPEKGHLISSAALDKQQTLSQAAHGRFTGD